MISEDLRVPSTPDVYKRWCAFGLLSTHSRLHGSTSYRVPWAI
ncbi:MAG: TIM-barrel domain-containing protein [Roseburia hominis]